MSESMQLLQNKALTITSCIDMCRASEPTTRQVKEMSEPASESVHAMLASGRRSYQQKSKPKSSNSKKKSQWKDGKSGTTGGSVEKGKCANCGLQHEANREKNCPAFGRRCSRCQKMNHYARCCKSKSAEVRQIEAQDSDSSYERMMVITDSESVRAVEDSPQCNKQMFATMDLVRGRSVRFQLDTGATCNVIRRADLPPDQKVRIVQTLKNAMKAMEMDGSDLHAKLQRFLFQYRNTPHTTTGLTPSELFLGRHVRTRLSMLRPEVSERIRAKQEKQMMAGPQATREFLKGDRVWVRNYHTPEKWKKGMVIAKCGSVDYQIQVGAHVWHRHANQMRPDHVTAHQESDIVSPDPLPSSAQTAQRPFPVPPSEPQTTEATSPAPVASAPNAHNTPVPVPSSTVIAEGDSSPETGRRYPSRIRRPPQRLDL